MSGIEGIRWGHVPAAAAPAWVGPGGTLVALWPTPVDADSCFREAGFAEFADSDEQWDDEWRRVVERLLGLLGQYGQARLLNREEVCSLRPRRWWEWLAFWLQPTEVVELGAVDRVCLSAEDDRFGEAVMHFGDPPAVTLRTSWGHPILWVAAAPGVALSGQVLAEGIAEGRPVIRQQLRWEFLIG